MYRINPAVSIQRGFRIPKEYSVIRYIQEGLYYPDMLTSDRVIVVTTADKTYGFNVASSIILESIILQMDTEDVIKRVATLYCVTEETARADYMDTIEQLIDANIIKEV